MQHKDQSELLDHLVKPLNFQRIDLFHKQHIFIIICFIILFQGLNLQKSGVISATEERFGKIPNTTTEEGRRSAQSGKSYRI